MLAPQSLRICCFAVMAPALTEAATQAQQSFKLPPSPASSASNSNPPSPLGTLTERCMGYDLLPYSNDYNRLKTVNLSSVYNGHTRTLKKFGPVDTSIRERIADDSSEVGGKKGQITLSANTMNKSDLPAQSNNMGIQQASAKLSLETHPRIEMDVPNVKDIMDVDTPASSPYSSSLENSLMDNGKRSEESALTPITRTALCNNISTPNTKASRSLTASVPLVSKRTAAIEKRADRLLHRLHKLQFKQSDKHITEQLNALIEHQRMCFSAGCPHRCNESNAVLSAELLQSEEMKSMSTAALVNLVRKLEAKNGPSVFRQKSNYSAFSEVKNSSLSNLCEGMNHDKIGVKFENTCIHTENNVKLSVDKSKEMRRVSGTISRNLRILENEIDSDATDSSSGGESCDELDGYTDKDKTPLKTLSM